MRWFRKTRRRRPSSVTKHYVEHKEAARLLVLARLEYFNQQYGLSYNRVAIRNQRRRWGSCSALGNLNFSYRLLFLPAELSDYVIVHEICHLKEFNHSSRFWTLVSKTIPDYERRRQALKQYDHMRASMMVLK